MFSDYRKIIGKYFSILQNAKQIKKNFELYLKERKRKNKLFRERIQKIYLSKCFFYLKINKQFRSLTTKKDALIKEIDAKYIIKQSFNVWKHKFKDIIRKKTSFIKFNDFFARISKKNITENFIFLKKYTQWQKQNLFIDSENFEITNEEKKDNKSEFEIRLEIKYKNLEKLIMKYENLKNISITFSEAKEKKNEFQDRNSIEQELSILKNMIKTQMKEIEDLKIQIL